MALSSNFPRMHVSFYVADLAATINFYTAFFNRPAEKVEKGYAKYILEKPSLVISFLENPARVQSNFGHLGIQVESEAIMRRYMALAKEKGLTIKEEIGTACCYALQDKFWVKDPDGIQWEIYYFHEDVAFNDPHYNHEESSACCLPQETANDQNIMNLQQNKPGTACEAGSGCC